MPYGIAKRFGGDSPANDAHMEKVVSALMRSGHDKGSAIAIAKSAQAKAWKGGKHTGSSYGHGGKK